MSDEVTTRTQKTRLALTSLRHVASVEGPGMLAAVKSVLIYGSEKWSLSMEDVRRLPMVQQRW